MAMLTDLDAPLRRIAHRIPPDILVGLSQTELELRVAEYQALMDEAEAAGNTLKGDRLRAKANRVLRACMPAGYDAAMGLMKAQLSQARLEQADMRAAAIQQEMRNFDKRHPQPSPERVMARVNAEVTRLAVPAPA